MFSPSAEDPTTPDTSDHSSDDRAHEMRKNVRDVASLSSSYLQQLAKQTISVHELANQVNGVDILIDMPAFSGWGPRFALHYYLCGRSIPQSVRAECADNIMSYVKSMQIDWSNEDIEKIFSRDFATQSEFMQEYPETNEDRIYEILRQLPPKESWSRSEIKIYETKKNHSMHEILQQLPRKRYFHIDKYITKVSKGPLLRTLDKNDITTDALRRQFPKAHLSVLAARIRREYDMDTFPLTPGERVVLSTCIKSGNPVDSILPQLPCRTKEYIIDRFKEVEVVTLRKRKFQSKIEQLEFEARWTIYESNKNHTLRNTELSSIAQTSGRCLRPRQTKSEAKNVKQMPSKRKSTSQKEKLDEKQSTKQRKIGASNSPGHKRKSSNGVVKVEDIEEPSTSSTTANSKYFSPTDLDSDSQIKLHGRQLFESSFYEKHPTVPRVNFIHKEETSENKVVDDTNSVLFEDNLARSLIQEHIKNYRSMPISFPLLDNPANIIRVRFLLYPEHLELFLLAMPRSNELDPIYEIEKLFMIHYTLFMSHSSTFRKLVESFCEKMEVAVEDNDFAAFVFVIDCWNLLMLFLTPNTKSASRILLEGREINPEIRYLITPMERRTPTQEDLMIDVLYEEFTSETTSPWYTTVATGRQEHFHIQQPVEFLSLFFKKLKEKKSISRFAMQQLLLRVYSRIVSPASRKLREYKSFTAEVYGELLPSFTSEVLHKLNFVPSQKFYDLGSGVGNATFQAALEFGAELSGGCELMEHALKLTELQERLLLKHLSVFGLKQMNLDFALLQSFVNNDKVAKSALDCDVLLVNNYLFDVNLNAEVGKLLNGLRPGTKIISLRNFIRPRYRATGDSIFDRLSVEKCVSDELSVSWTGSRVVYYISTVQENPVYPPSIEAHN